MRCPCQAVLADKPEFQPAVRRNAALRRMAEGILAELPPDDVVALGHVLRHGEGDVPAGNVVRLAERVA
jgi:hypothetical protein